MQVAVPRRVEEALEQAGVLLAGRREPVVAAGEVGMGPVEVCLQAAADRPTVSAISS